MPMRKTVLLFGAVLCLISCAKTPNAGDDGHLWWKHIEYLASDDLQGRYTGSEGYRKAANYVAQQFQSLGLQPKGTDGYLQPAKFDTRRLIPENFGYDSGSDQETLVNAWFEQRYHAPSDDLKQPVDKQAAAKFNQLMATL